MKPRYFITERLVREARMAPREAGPFEIEAIKYFHAYLATQYEEAVMRAFGDCLSGGTGMTQIVYEEGAERTADHRNATGVIRTRWVSRKEFEREYPPAAWPPAAKC